MARNQEKANAMLNLFLQAKKDADARPIERRPHLASSVTDLPSCEHWRRQVIRDVTREIAAIQNASLGEHKIRDLNDTINKLLREKKHWEKQIKALGGPDYEATAPKIVDHDGRRAMGSEGYYYFGAAKELPGVRELFERSAPTQQKQTRTDLYKLVDAEYYGFKDEDDGLLVRLEADAEKLRLAEAEEEYKKEQLELQRAQLLALGMKDEVAKLDQSTGSTSTSTSTSTRSDDGAMRS